ncbi:MAG: outer membrane lipoprotein carrier protein LolA [Bacteroidaceae bacterium]|nr:outer membrane lipoprotein carrier protein LolA [Bacteroidaceae bacterium]
MYKKCPTLLFLLFLSIGCTAQDRADGLLQKCILLLEKSTGIQAKFTSTLRFSSGEENSSSGEIYLKKERFKIVTPRSISWFDGTTLWSYVSLNEEVTISEPTTEELNEMNPYALISNYKQKYTAHYQGEEVLHQEKTYCIKLVPQDMESDFSSIKVYLTVKDLQPLSITSRLKNGDNGTISIDTFHATEKLSNAFFHFPTKEYPTAELIDMR